MLTKLYKLLLNDKLQHFVYGIAVYSIFVPFGSLIALLVTSFVAWLKEKFDSKGYGQKDKWDIVATVAGGLFLMLWYTIIDKLQSLF